MKKEELLEKARLQAQGGEYEQAKEDQSDIFAGGIAFLFALTLFFVQLIVKQQYNFGLIAVGTAFVSANLLLKGVFLKIKKKTVFGCLLAIATIALAAAEFIF